MEDYQSIARKFRPQTFAEVVGQDVIVTTLKNAIKNNRLADAYIFCGSRGTGKTTFVRIFAKALNCLSLLPSTEPCNGCSSCKEIINGCSLDVIEIDGASNRSIDDIRKINDTVAYATSNGKYKIYIIDEVHMLTKEAFNALLKTLEEPPPKVKFFFATTEAHKVLPTILSRCQRFNLKRISIEAITHKLELIAKSLDRNISQSALRQIARKAEGGLRDAESLLDQIFAYHEGDIEEEVVTSALGIVPKELYFTLDREGKAGNLSSAFLLASQVFSEGKDLPFFIEGLLEHYRNLNVIKLSGKNCTFLPLTQEEFEKYEQSASCYSQEQLLAILDICIEAQTHMRHMPSLRIAIESLLLRIMRMHQKIPLEQLVERLTLLEKKAHELPEQKAMPVQVHVEQPVKVEQLPKVLIQKEENKPQNFVSEQTIVKPTSEKPFQKNISEDPTPTEEDLKGIVKKAPSLEEKAVVISKKKQAQYDTVLQFAAVELEGRIQRK